MKTKILGIILIVILWSCDKQEILDETKSTFAKDLQINLTQVKAQFNYNKKEGISVQNQEFFKLLDLAKNDLKLSDSIINNSTSNISQGNDFTEKEIIVLQRYFLERKSYPTTESLKITDQFINLLDKLSIQNEYKSKLNDILIFQRDLIVYTNYNVNDESNQKNIWNCAHRECIDCCMFWKLKDLENANLIDQLAFLATAAESTAIIVISCAYDCAQ